MKNVFFIFLIASISMVQARTTFTCSVKSKGLKTELETVIISADMITNNFGQTTARNVTISTATSDSWAIGDFAYLRPLDKAALYRVPNKGDSYYFKSVLLTTTPLGHYSFYEAEVGVVIGNDGPEELKFKTEGDVATGDSDISFQLDCEWK